MSTLILSCKVAGCEKRTEGTTGLCATHNRSLRQISNPRLKKVSVKRAEANKIYEEKRLAFLRKNPRCAVFPNLRSQDVHHQKGRVGELFLNEDFWLPVSRKAHTLITLKPKWALEKGYSLPRS